MCVVLGKSSCTPGGLQTPVRSPLKKLSDSNQTKPVSPDGLVHGSKTCPGMVFHARSTLFGDVCLSGDLRKQGTLVTGPAN